MRFILFLLFIPFISGAQDLDVQIQSFQSDYEELESKQKEILQQIEKLKLDKVIADLKNIGLPSDNYIEHSAMILEYSEAHEQAKWVAHIITPDILTSYISRTNDFRIDPKVSTGTAIEQDYFLKELQADSTYKYDGFGYDRGHLAPSADFRWSHTALSESYFYSNMSPQVADFNRGKWGELEALVRGYVFRNPNQQLYVVTLPILEEKLPVIERSINKVAIPKSYLKVVVDLEQQEGIAFFMQNKKLNYPLSHYAISIDRAEELSGFDFFNKLDEDIESKLEAQFNKAVWFPQIAQGDVDPLYQPSLPPGHFNTIVAKKYVNKNKSIIVCGKVVKGRSSKKGNVLLNLDQNYPNEIFTVFIRKPDILNFSYNPELTLKNKEYCFEGKIKNYMGHPVMDISSEKQVSTLDLKFGYRK